MSRTIELNVTFSAGKGFTAVSILENLTGMGWNPIYNGKVNHLPVGDKDMYNWTTAPLTSEELFQVFIEKEHAKETIGVDIYWEDTGIGVCLLVISLNELLFSLDINTRHIEGTELIDFNWYTKRILPALEQVATVTKYSLEYMF